MLPSAVLLFDSLNGVSICAHYFSNINSKKIYKTQRTLLFVFLASIVLGFEQKDLTSPKKIEANADQNQAYAALKPMRK